MQWFVNNTLIQVLETDALCQSPSAFLKKSQTDPMQELNNYNSGKLSLTLP